MFIEVSNCCLVIRVLLLFRFEININEFSCFLVGQKALSHLFELVFFSLESFLSFVVFITIKEIQHSIGSFVIRREKHKLKRL